MATTYLTRTAGTGSRRKFTTSLWVKRSKTGSPKQDLMAYNKTPNYNIEIQFQADDTFRFYSYNNSSTTVDFITNRVFRDTNAWYNIILAVDTEQSIEADRFKIYINGVQETSFSTEDYPSLNEDLSISHGETIAIGAWATSGDYFNGYMSYVIFIDGTQYAASTFGSTDATTGEWKINTSPTVTYGTNGFFLFKNNAAVTDQSGQGNNFTLAAGTLTKTEDCPSNVFATFNTLCGANTMAAGSTFSNGNNTVVNSGSVYNPYGTTLGVNKGKFYAEFKADANMGDGMIGVLAKYGASSNGFGTQTQQYSWYFTASAGNITSGGSNIVTSVGTIALNDIIGIALDCDNNKLYFHKNGTYISNGSGTGNPSSGTNGIPITDPDDTDLGCYFFSACDWGGSTRGHWSANFGNGYFGTSAVSSAGTNASNIGIFEYDVPTGYTALSTKGLNE
jgi:hypothetical protein